jgi:hypothetical protein
LEERQIILLLEHLDWVGWRSKTNETLLMKLIQARRSGAVVSALARL